MTLEEVYKQYSGPEGLIGRGYGDKGTQHTYIQECYSRFFNFQDTVNILEIGVYLGHSIALWEEFFSGDSNIVGMDIDISRIQFDLSGCTLIKGDATKPEALNALPKISYDFIIDDGSHALEDQLKSFEIFFPLLKDGGVYFIEDINLSRYGDAGEQKLRSLYKNVEIIDNRGKTNCQDVIAIIKK